MKCSELEGRDYSVRILHDVSGLKGIVDEWAALPQATEYLPLSADWILTAADSLHREYPLHAILVRKSGEVCALAPLATTSRVTQQLEFIGAASIYEPAGVLYRDEAALAALCEAMVTSARPLVLQRIAADGSLLQAFKAAARGRGRLLEFNASGTPYTNIQPSWDAYCAGLSARRGQDYRRARRGLEKVGKVTVEIRDSTDESTDAELAEAMQVEAASWKGRNGSALLQRDRLRDFFAKFARGLARQGMLRICSLRVDGTAIAMQVCAEFGRRWWVMKIGYDERWSKYSPGIQLMWDVIREAHERGVKSFEMLGTDEPWLSIWAREQRAFRTLVFYPYNARGAASFCGAAAKSLGRRLRIASA